MDAGQGPGAWRFDRFTLDLARGALLDPDGAEIPLRPKSMALLRVLIENAGRVVDRDTIMEAVWPSVIVTDESITQCVRDLRKTLGDEAQALLRTVPKRGYLLAAEAVPAETTAPTPRADRRLAAILAADRPAPILALPDRPSIAVLPFQNMSSDDDQDYFADGVAEEIITALSRMRWLFVIARNSSFIYKG